MNEFPKEIAKRIARNVRVLRSQMGLTQETLSHRSGIAVRHLQKVEAGQVNVTLATLVRLSSALGVDPSELLKR